MMTEGASVSPECGVEEQYRRSLDKGVFLIQRCGECDRHVFFPREICPHCGSARLEWVEPGGRGVVHAVTTVRRKPESGGDYNVSLIELDESVRLMSRVEGVALDEIGIGLRVRARVSTADGHGVVVFDAIHERDIG